MIFNGLEEAKQTVRLGLRIIRLAIGVGRVVRIDDLGDFDEDIMLIVLVEGVHSLLVHVSHHVHRRQVHVLDRLHDVGELLLGRLEHLQHVVEVGAGDDGDVTALRLDWAKKGTLSDHSKCPFRTDEQVLEVSSCVIFSHRGHVIQNSAIGQDCSQADAIRMERVVTDELDTACVRSKVTANEAGALGSEVQRHLIATNLGVVLNVTKDAASFCTHDTIRLVESENAIHALCIQDDFVMNGHRSTNKACAAALRDDGKLALVAIGQDRTNIGSVLWLEHDR